MAVLVAALPVLAGMGMGVGGALGPSTVTGSDSGSLASTGPALLVDRRGPAATQRTRPTRPTLPRSSVVCFPIGRAEPTRPATPGLPRAAPRMPGPVPIPEVAITCSNGLLVGSRVGGGR